MSRMAVWYMQIVSNDPKDMDGGFGDKTLQNYLNNFKEKTENHKISTTSQYLVLAIPNCRNKIPQKKQFFITFSL